MTIQSISTVTLAFQDMARSVEFHQKVGLTLAHGGRQSGFTSLQAGQGFINLIHALHSKPCGFVSVHPGDWIGVPSLTGGECIFLMYCFENHMLVEGGEDALGTLD